jgi:uncharacterized protein (TIGR03663 family)
MNRRKFYIVSWILIFLLAAALRLPSLSLRPMHTDEAVHAVKFTELLEAGHYQYNPQEFHGPTLYYLTLPLAWAGGYHTLAQLNEFILRLVSVVWGLLVIFIFIRLGQQVNQINLRTILLAGLFYAVSSIIVYYNRYYIHETLLTVFVWSMLAYGYLFIKEKKGHYAVLSGISLGLLISTKETWVIYIAAVVISVILLPEWRKAVAANIIDIGLLILTPALLIVGLFYTSFFTNPQGIPDFIQSFGNYFQRGVSHTIHTQPWYYYIQTLIYFKGSHGPVWTEGFLLILSILGAGFVLLKKFPSGTAASEGLLLRFVSVFTLSVMLIFSLIPYKMPWNILGWMPGLVLLAGWTIDNLLSNSNRKAVFFFVSLFLLLGSLHAAWQCWQLNYRYECDPANPYVYAHTGKDIELVKKTMIDLAHVSDEDALRIDVIFSGYDYWPLPWYLRSFRYVGWWNNLDPENPPAPVILLSVDQEENLLKLIYELTPVEKRQLYMRLFSRDIELRPGLIMRGYISYDLWQELKPSRQTLETHP